MMSGSECRIPPRASRVISEDVGAEVVVFDPRCNVAHALSGTAAAVWWAADDGRVPAGLSEFELSAAVDELIGLGLLDDGRPGLSRRQALVAGGILVSGITSLAIPTAAAAQSGIVSFTSPGSSYTVTLPAGQTTMFTLVGGGGGGGGIPPMYASAGQGGDGGIVNGTIQNTDPTNPATLTVVVASGGWNGGAAGDGAINQGDGQSDGGTGGNSDVGAGGGSGGGSSAILTGSTPLVIAPGGGGGGGTDGPAPGGTGSNGMNGGSGETTFSAAAADGGGGTSGAGGGGGGGGYQYGIGGPVGSDSDGGSGGAGGSSIAQNSGLLVVNVTSTTSGGAGQVPDGPITAGAGGAPVRGAHDSEEAGSGAAYFAGGGVS